MTASVVTVYVGVFVNNYQHFFMNNYQRFFSTDHYVQAYFSL